LKSLEKLHPEPAIAFPPAKYFFIWHLLILTRMNILKPIGIAVCISVFFLLLGISWTYLQTSGVYLEPFESNPITRASDCQCLPGYIPSNQSTKYEFVLTPDGNGYILTGKKIRYQFYWNMYDKPLNWETSKARWTTFDEVNNYNFEGLSPVTVLDDALQFVKEGRKNQPFYFCQKLGDPSKTRACY
jgi:hypothetical protein